MGHEVVTEVRWKDLPDEHDYPAAESYLLLVMRPAYVHVTVTRLRESSIEHYKAKDILRASGHAALPVDNKHVKKNLDRIDNGTPLSPILLVRAARGKVIIADGYHRVCALYHHDEDASLPCKIASCPDPIGA